MKNLALVVVFSIFTFIQNGNAQTEKGTLLLGGSASFQRVEEESLLSFSPNVGYFIADKFALGLNMGITSFDDFRVLSLGPSVRGYFLTTEKGSLFATAGFNYLNVSFDGNSESETGYSIGAGYAIFLNRSIALEVSANYAKLGNSSGNSGIIGTDDSIFSVNVGFQIHFKD